MPFRQAARYRLRRKKRRRRDAGKLENTSVFNLTFKRGENRNGRRYWDRLAKLRRRESVGGKGEKAGEAGVEGGGPEGFEAGAVEEGEFAEPDAACFGVEVDAHVGKAAGEGAGGAEHFRQ